MRGDAEYAAGHIPGARHLPAVAIAPRLAEIPRGRPVVTYCNMCHCGDSRSERAATLLRASGLEAQALEGGFPRREAAGYPVERGEERASQPLF